MRSLTNRACASEPWIHDDVRHLLGAFGRHAHVYNVYSAGDSGEGCEIVEFTIPSSGGAVPWTARVYVEDRTRFTECTVGWA
jgi:hypothetical protein